MVSCTSMHMPHRTLQNGTKREKGDREDMLPLSTMQSWDVQMTPQLRRRPLKSNWMTVDVLEFIVYCMLLNELVEHVQVSGTIEFCNPVPILEEY